MSMAVILAGGGSRRMGRDKLAMELDGQTLLGTVVGRFADEFDEVCISVADAGKYPEIAARRIVDVIPGAGPLSGLHAVFTELTVDGVFLVAADLPFACPRAARRIMELCGDKDAAVIRLPDGKLEPLFGYYRRTVLPRCLEAISAGNNRMYELVLGSDTRFIAPAELGGLWDEKLIINVNNPEDFEKAAIEFKRGQC